VGAELSGAAWSGQLRTAQRALDLDDVAGIYYRQFGKRLVECSHDDRRLDVTNAGVRDDFCVKHTAVAMNSGLQVRRTRWPWRVRSSATRATISTCSARCLRTRVEWAALKSGDPLASAAADFYVAGELIATAEWDGALTYLDGARRNIEDELRTENEAALAMYGQLHLKSGLAAARAGDADTADSHLAEAGELATRVTPGSDHYRLAFDADSVNIWSVGLAVERQAGTEAVKRADGLRFS
jgi:hypothetical protein